MFTLVAEVVAREMPLTVVLSSALIVDGECEEGWLLVRVDDPRCFQVAGECILLRRAGMVCHFELGSMEGRVVVNVDVACTAEAVVRWGGGGGGRESVVYIREAGDGVSARDVCLLGKHPDLQCG